jgi:hypothetical protein
MWFRARFELFAATAFVIVAFGGSAARAWNGVGHMVVAKLAFDRLSADEQDRLAEVLKQHPHYDNYLAASRPDGVDERLWTVMRSGVWSDWIRPPRRLQQDPATHPVYRFHRGPWHYVNFPLKAHQSENELPAAPLPGPTNILEQLSLCRRFAAATTESDPGAEASASAEANRAVRVCWLVHLVGDLHQPLHAVSLIDERRLPGPMHDDQGGNLLAVRVEIGAFPIRLHSMWDQMLGTDNAPESVLRLAEELAREASPTDDVAEKFTGDDTFRAWAAESYAAAKQYGYLDGDLPTAVWDESRPPLPAVDDVPILPVGVERDARKVARQRIIAAGRRLAMMLSLVLSTS